MNAISFFLITDGNFWQSFYVLVVASGLVSIFIYSFFRGKFGKLGKPEKIVAVLVLLVGVAWKVTGNPYIANISLQIIFLLSVIPTIIGVLRGHLIEKELPWYLAVASHGFATMGIITSGSFTWTSLVYPLVTGVLGNGVVAVAVFCQNKKSIQIH